MRYFPPQAGVELNFAGKAQILGFCAGVELLGYYVKKGDNYKAGDLLGAAYYARTTGARHAPSLSLSLACRRVRALSFILSFVE